MCLLQRWVDSEDRGVETQGCCGPEQAAGGDAGPRDEADGWYD